MKLFQKLKLLFWLLNEHTENISRDYVLIPRKITENMIYQIEWYMYGFHEVVDKPRERQYLIKNMWADVIQTYEKEEKCKKT
ncbi:MAG TPA: hypothetical protein VK553_11385 [Candidatus Nitrosopolaris rasttigaisensis]|nr:hypothetical protein [Candidatus Nitrosopolaris rasttigaisensis]